MADLHAHEAGNGGQGQGRPTAQAVLFYSELPPPDAAMAAEWLGVSRVIPVHYPPGDSAPEDLRRELAARGSRVELVTLEFGETWTQKDSLSATSRQRVRHIA